MALYLCLGQEKWLSEEYLEAGHQENHYREDQNRFQPFVFGPKDGYLLPMGPSILPQKG